MCFIKLVSNKANGGQSCQLSLNHERFAMKWLNCFQVVDSRLTTTRVVQCRMVGVFLDNGLALRKSKNFIRDKPPTYSNSKLKVSDCPFRGTSLMFRHLDALSNQLPFVVHGRQITALA